MYRHFQCPKGRTHGNFRNVENSTLKAGRKLKFWKKFEVLFSTYGTRILRYWSFILTSTVTVSLKLVFSNELFSPSRKDILRRIHSIELKFSGFVVLSTFCEISIELFHPVHSVKVMPVLKRMLDFLNQI